jgi:N-acylneuraminate cytidylyltransferase/CMP-N,N'-diacetyllegionaminic acid synthase
MDLCGCPLLGWPIRAAKNSKYVDRVVVSTEDREIAAIADAQGAEVPFIRPLELADDTASSAAVIIHAISKLRESGHAYDYLVLLEPTSPLTEPTDIDGALECLEQNRMKADSIVGVSLLEGTHPAFVVSIHQNGLIQPFLAEDFRGAGRQQDISELYYFEGSLYISDVNVFIEKKAFYHDRTLPYVVPKWKAFEVDDIVDFLCVEAIMRNIEKIRK